MALQAVDSHLRSRGADLLVFDAFRDDLASLVDGKFQDGLGKGPVKRFPDDLLDDAAVDLDEVDGQAAELGKCGNTLAEIIQSEETAGFFQHVHEFPGGF